MLGSQNKYRPDIDGLRALAILGVLLYHIDERLVPGGYVGVDVFFVISGYLISGIIDRDLRMGKFSILNFYERRIRRIFPALAVMLCVILTTSWFALLPDDLINLAKSVRYVVGTLPNIYFYKETGNYFNDSINQLPLLHTWSLGVEEQFYLIFPVILGACYRWFKPLQRTILLILLFTVSLTASAWLVVNQPMQAFYLLPYRAWEMLLGTLISLVALPKISKGMSQFASGLGMLLILASMALFSNKTTFPGVSALLPCMGSALLLLANRDHITWSSRLLSLKPIVSIGLISYSVYLWHWPLIVLAKYVMVYSGTTKMLILIGSLILGYLSWRYVEKPFRNPKLHSRKWIFSMWGAVSIFLVCIALMIERHDGFTKRFTREVRDILFHKKKAEFWKRGDGKHMDVTKPAIFGKLDTVPKVALWGDSHAVAIIPALEAVATESNQSFATYTMSGLPPVIGVVKVSTQIPEPRLRYSHAVFEKLVTDESIKTVVLHARWSFYLLGPNESNAVSTTTFDGQLLKSQDSVNEFYASRVRTSIQRLLAVGKKVVLVYPIPEVGFNVPNTLAKQAIAGGKVSSTFPCHDFERRQSFVIDLLDSLGVSDQIIRIKPHEVLLQDGMIKVTSKKLPLFLDDDHLSVPGALYLKSLFEPVFREAAK